jgi:prepilin-type N-terminal cleavage/methylation domain-containing protein
MTLRQQAEFLHPYRAARGFTLIELLVVVTIIVVLLALLTPALDKAIYAAEFAVCGAQVRNIGSGALGYTMDHRRSYPYRGGEASRGNQPVDLANNAFDDRPRLKGYLSMGINGHLNCPLTGSVDIEGSEDDTWILAPYAMYFGWSFIDEAGQPLPGMKRMGSRMVWRDAAGTKNYRFTVLACDDDLIINSDNWGHGTHPDADGKWSHIVMQDEGIILPTPIAGVAGLKVTLSRYTGPPRDRGPVDLNFAFQDGSVERYDRIAWDEPQERVVQVPYTSGTRDDANFYRHLPPK